MSDESPAVRAEQFVVEIEKELNKRVRGKSLSNTEYSPIIFKAIGSAKKSKVDWQDLIHIAQAKFINAAKEEPDRFHERFASLDKERAFFNTIMHNELNRMLKDGSKEDEEDVEDKYDLEDEKVEDSRSLKKLIPEFMDMQIDDILKKGVSKSALWGWMYMVAASKHEGLIGRIKMQDVAGAFGMKDAGSMSNGIAKLRRVAGDIVQSARLRDAYIGDRNG